MSRPARFRRLGALSAAFAVLLAVVVPVWAPASADEAAVPGRPSGLEIDVSAGPGAVGLDWGDVDGAEEYLVRWRAHGAGNALNDGERVAVSEAVIDVGAAGGWVVLVRACNTAGCGPRVNRHFTVAVVAPSQSPTGLSIDSSAGPGSVALDWDDTAGAAEYWVRWRQAGAGNPLNNGIRVAASQAIINVGSAGGWVALVQACNTAGCGPRVNRHFAVAQIAPSQSPTGLSIDSSGGPGAVVLDWDDTPRAAEYLVRWRAHGPGNPLNTGTRVAVSEATIDVGSAGGWVALIQACNSGGCGPRLNRHFTVQAAAEPEPPAQPANLEAAAAAGDLDVDLGWDAVDGATSYVVRWQPQAAANALRSTGNTQTSTGTVTVTTAAATATVPAAGTWQFSVTACNANGCSAAASVGYVLRTTPDPPGLPSNADAATTQGSRDVNVTWDAADGAVNYRLKWRPDTSRDFDAAHAVETAATSATVTVSAFGTWVFQLEACNTGGCGPTAAFTASVEDHPRTDNSLTPRTGGLVSNIGQTPDSANVGKLNENHLAQCFETGTNTAGYTLESIVVKFSTAPSANIRVQLASGGSKGGLAIGQTGADVIDMLDNPAAFVVGDNTFTAPAGGIRLFSGTQYFVIVAETGTSKPGRTSLTQSNDEDTGGATGWSICNGILISTGGTGAWSANSASKVPIRVNGHLGPKSSELVSNRGQADSATAVDADQDRVFSFRAGTDANGYTLTGVDIDFSFPSGSQPGYSLILLSGGMEVGRFTGPATLVDGVNRFTLATPHNLIANSSYFLEWDQSSSVSTFKFKQTASTAEDSGAVDGWTVSDSGSRRSHTDTSRNDYATDSDSWKIAVLGFTRDLTAPKVESAVLGRTAKTLTATFNEDLNPNAPAAGQFQLGTVSGTTFTAVDTATGVSVDGNVVTATFTTLTANTTHVRYQVPAANPLKDVNGNQAAEVTRAFSESDIAGRTTNFVSNFDLGDGATSSNRDFFQKFTTGSHTPGYELTDVELNLSLGAGDPPDYTLKLLSEDKTAEHGTFTGPATLVIGDNTFTLAEAVDLSANTTYTLFWDQTTSAAAVNFTETGSDGEDPGAADGWSIADTSEQGAWNTAIRTADAESVVIKVRGFAKADTTPSDTDVPVLLRARVAGTSLSLTYDEALDGGSVPAPGDFSVSVDGAARTVSTVAVDGSTVTLTLSGSAVAAGTVVTVDYTKGTSPIQDSVGNDAADLSDELVGSKVVSNVGQTSTTTSASADDDNAQAFTAGAGGFTLTSVGVSGNAGTVSSALSVDVFNADQNGLPTGATLGTLTAPSSFTAGVNEFTAPAGGISLVGGNGYLVVFDYQLATPCTGCFTIHKTAFNDQDSGAATGWSIDDIGRHRSQDTTTWSSSDSLKIEIYGIASDSTAPTVVSAKFEPTDRTLTVTFNEALKSSALPNANRFSLLVTGIGNAATSGSISGKVLTLGFPVTLNVAANATLGFKYTPTGNASDLQDAHGNKVASISNQAVTRIDTTAPTVESAVIAANGATLTVTFSEALKAGSSTNHANWILSGTRDSSPTISAAGLQRPALGNPFYTMSLSPPARSGETITLEYSQDFSPTVRIKDTSDNVMPSFSGRAVTNNSTVPGGTPPPPPPPPQAPSTPSSAPGGAAVSVGNLGQGNGSIGGAADHAQVFTTGPHAAGYRVNQVKVRLANLGTSTIPHQVGIWSVGSNGQPAGLVGALVSPAVLVSGNNVFTSSSGIDLAASTAYAVVWDNHGSDSNFFIRNTASDGEDAGAAAGWSISDTSWYRGRGSTGGWTSFGDSRMIEVSGTEKYTASVEGLPELASARLTGSSQITLVFSEPMLASIPAADDDPNTDDTLAVRTLRWARRAFTVGLSGGADYTITGVAYAPRSDTVVLTVDRAVGASETVRLVCCNQAMRDLDGFAMPGISTFIYPDYPQLRSAEVTGSSQITLVFDEGVWFSFDEAAVRARLDVLFPTDTVQKRNERVAQQRLAAWSRALGWRVGGGPYHDPTAVSHTDGSDTIVMTVGYSIKASDTLGVVCCSSRLSDSDGLLVAGFATPIYPDYPLLKSSDRTGANQITLVFDEAVWFSFDENAARTRLAQLFPSDSVAQRNQRVAQERLRAWSRAIGIRLEATGGWSSQRAITAVNHAQGTDTIAITVAAGTLDGAQGQKRINVTCCSSLLSDAHGLVAAGFSTLISPPEPPTIKDAETSGDNQIILTFSEAVYHDYDEASARERIARIWKYTGIELDEAVQADRQRALQWGISVRVVVNGAYTHPGIANIVLRGDKAIITTATSLGGTSRTGIININCCNSILKNSAGLPVRTQSSLIHPPNTRHR